MTSAVKAVKFSAKLVGNPATVACSRRQGGLMPATLEWFGTATFRVRDAGLNLFFDAYLDRLPGLDAGRPVDPEVGEADFVFVSHSHFDHLYGADVLALGAGATVVASPESARCLREAGVPEQQLLVVTGGETVHCGPTTKVRVLPALHACLFAHSDPDTSVAVPRRSRRERAGPRRHDPQAFRGHGRRARAGGPGPRVDEREVLPPRRRPARLPAR